MNVADVLKQKSAAIHSIEVTASLADAVQRFTDAPMRCLVVTQGDQVVGMLTMRDLLRSLHAHGAALDTAVGAAMSKDVASVTPSAALEEVERLIVSRRINHVPVLDGAKLVGVVTLSDILRVHLTNVSGMQGELLRYIHGPYAFEG